MIRRLKTLFLLFVTLTGCVGVSGQQARDDRNTLKLLQPGLEVIKPGVILDHIKKLASDEFEGRAPGTRGETLTVDYLVEQFKRSGLKPGNPDGTFLQKVPLVGFAPHPDLTFNIGDKPVEFRFPDDYFGRSRRLLEEVTVEDSEIIFVGYGVIAPEYGWDDYKNVDVTGKTVVILDNDPQIMDFEDTSKFDNRMFKGNGLTYYGTRSYKYETAAKKGAAAVLIIHDPKTSVSSLKNLQNGYLREAFEIKQRANSAKIAAFEGWLTSAAAERLFAAADQEISVLKRSALTKVFQPLALSVTANIDVKSTLREIESRNVVAKIEGSDAHLKNQYIIYTAHWDHLGRDEKLTGDQIYNGAIDNAGGIGQMLEIARGFAMLKKPPRRSILFIATTAEERGLLGSKYYVANPLYSLSLTLANINLDSVNPFGRTKDVIESSFGLTTLDEILIKSAATQNRILTPDPSPEAGYLFRSDQFEFIRAGVPAIFPGGGLNFIGKPADYGEKKWTEYDQRYHQVTDEVDPNWDMSGAVEDAQLFLQVGYRIAQSEKYPEWKAGAEFKTRREEMINRPKKKNLL